MWPTDTPARRFFIACAVILLVAIGVRLVGIDRSLWLDEAGSIEQAQAEHFWTHAQNDVHPPLYFFLLRGLLHVTSSFAALRAFSLFWGVALVGLALFALRENRTAALIAGWLLATWPGFVDHGRELRPYALWYFFLGASLLIAGAQWRYGLRRSRSLALVVILLIASCIHLLTFPFILALAPLLLWPVRRRGLRSWIRTAWPAIPAVILLLVWRFAFVTAPQTTQEGWWMPPATVLQFAWSMNLVIAWSDVGWLYNAGQTFFPGAGAFLSTFAMGVGLFGVAAAWLNRRAASVTWAYLAVAVSYVAVVCGYSLYLQPIIWHRTLLPLMLPVSLSLAWGISTRSSSWSRTAAAAAISLYSLLTLLHIVATAAQPFENLQGLTVETRREHRTGDFLVLMRSMDFALRPYWPDLDRLRPVNLNLANPDPKPFADFAEQLRALPPAARVIVVAREDQYFKAHPDRFVQLLDEIRNSGRTVNEAWREGLYVLYVAEASRSHP